jgi:hypothetical protein
MRLQYKIKIKKDDFELECEGDKKFVLDLLKRYGPGVTPESKPASPQSTARKQLDREAEPSVQAKQVPPGEFIRRIGSSKHTDLVLAFGYYLEKVNGLRAFTPADINNCYYEAKLEMSNTSQMIILNTKKGFMMQAKRGDESERKKYTLTASGEQYVESLAEKNSSKAP